VEDGVVLGRPEHAEQAALVLARILEQAQRLVCVGCDTTPSKRRSLSPASRSSTPPSRRRIERTSVERLMRSRSERALT
jgi:hypothetical protein